MKKIAINGFGRIGKMIMKVSLERNDIEVVAINDLLDIEYLAYILKYDSVHGNINYNVSIEGNFLIINNKKIRVTNQPDINKLNWGELDVEVVVDCTGLFMTADLLKGHFDSGTKRVVMSGPSKDDTKMYVKGVNTETLKSNDLLISNASCTTNCLAPLSKIINDNFGIEEALMTTVHAATASQKIVDSPSKKDWRAGRSGLNNIIPASTGAAESIGKIIPSLKGKMTGISFRVPTVNVSVVDLTVRFTKPTNKKEIDNLILKASQNEFSGIIAFENDELVSSDLNGRKESCIYDSKASIMLNDKFAKLIAWYDNETGYSNRLLDIISIWY